MFSVIDWYSCLGSLGVSRFGGTPCGAWLRHRSIGSVVFVGVCFAMDFSSLIFCLCLIRLRRLSRCGYLSSRYFMRGLLRSLGAMLMVTIMGCWLGHLLWVSLWSGWLLLTMGIYMLVLWMMKVLGLIMQVRLLGCTILSCICWSLI